MATGKKTGKKAADIFQATIRPDISLEVAPRPPLGRTPAPEPYEKLTVCTYRRHVVMLDRALVAIRERTGLAVNRAELIRALLERAAPDLDPNAPSFDKLLDKIRS